MHEFYQSVVFSGMISSPANNVRDPVVALAGQRVRVLPQRSSRCMDVLEGIPFCPASSASITTVRTVADRFLWSTDGWARMPGHMRDRLIRQEAKLVMSDYFWVV